MSKLDDVLAKIKALKEEFKVTAKAALIDLTTEFFTRFPEVSQLTWTQYTPYFNDGEPCIFGVHEVGFVPTDDGATVLGLTIPEDGEWSEGEYATQWDLKGEYDSKTHNYSGPTPRGGDLTDDLRTIDKLLDQIEGALENIFGDHVRVFINADGTAETEEHDHD